MERIHPREPTRVPLANMPTRIDALRYPLPVPVWIKRDDQTGSEMSGNKVRKLEYLMAEALAQGATHVITCGGEQSNHARATAFAAIRLGLASVLVLRCDDPAHPPATTGNILLDRIGGAEIVWITRAEWRERNARMAQAADRVRASGGRPYVIPEGGSSALGAWGYVRAARELWTQIAELPRPCTVLTACGSGGTAAGLVLGAKLFDFAARGIRLATVNVCDDRAYFVDAILRICRDADARWELGVSVTEGDLDIVDGYVGAGYARSRPEELATLNALARRDGVVLDPVYTGKAFHALATELGRDPARFGASVAFVHTGGLFGCFAAPDLATAASA